MTGSATHIIPYYQPSQRSLLEPRDHQDSNAVRFMISTEKANATAASILAVALWCKMTSVEAIVYLETILAVEAPTTINAIARCEHLRHTRYEAAADCAEWQTNKSHQQPS